MSDLADIVSDLPVIGLGGSYDLPQQKKDLFAVTSRKSWGRQSDARCDFQSYPSMTRRGGLWFHHIWRRSIKGMLLTDIKLSDEQVDHFAERVKVLLRDLISDDLSDGDWALVTTPSRRHKDRNFADLVCRRISEICAIPYFKDCATCTIRQRVNAVFNPNNIPPQANIIVFDDIVTSGSTLKAMRQLLQPLGKNLLFIVGINNKL